MSSEGLSLGHKEAWHIALNGENIAPSHCRFLQEPNAEFTEFAETYIDVLICDFKTRINNKKIKSCTTAMKPNIGERRFIFYAAKIKINQRLSECVDLFRDM